MLILRTLDLVTRVGRVGCLDHLPERQKRPAGPAHGRCSARGHGAARRRRRRLVEIYRLPSQTFSVSDRILGNPEPSPGIRFLVTDLFSVCKRR